MKKLKTKKFTFNLKNKLLLSFLLVLLVPSCIIAYTSYMSAKDNTDNRMMETARESVELVDHTINQLLQAQMENVDFLSNAISAETIINGSTEEIQTLLNRNHDSKADIDQTYVGTSEGDFLTAPESIEQSEDYDPRERPWYQQAMENQSEIVITEPYVSNSTQDVVVTIAQTTEDGQGVIGVDLNLGNLAAMVDQINIGKEGYVFLLDGSSHYITHPSNEAGSEATESFIKDLYVTDKGTFDYKFEGDKKKLAFTTNESAGWKIAGSMYQSEVDDAVAPILHTTLFVIAGALAIGIAIVLLIIRSITRPVNNLVEVANKMSKGDLTVSVTNDSNDEIGQLAQAFNRMRKHLNEVIVQVRDKANNLAASSEELNASSQQNTVATEQITNSIQDVASGVESQSSSIDSSSRMAQEMSSSIQQIATSSNEVSSTAADATTVVDAGNKAIKTTVGQMEFIKKTVHELSGNIKGLGNKTREIGEIVDVITNIAEQTNLLALNAAIEAARAGEHGKGFAVVADEVRKLAEQSSQSSEQIKNMIQSIQSESVDAVKAMETGTTEVDRGIEVVSEAGQSFNDITSFVNTVTTQIQQVASKIQEISSGTDQFVETFDSLAGISETTSGAAQNVSASTEEQLASMEEITDSANSLSIMAEELQEVVEQFKL
ncbi:methyl-accepting chemotaxis protein [Oceanobacillus jordanicus]|uniref:Methyl-accepting chemotaxis protein n=1 Tax=Oceanobacillus jordanicus TaxID=2867266 RepID=A0AAW5B8J4_9BACI|nr:methyl-accepting chemotaxis protein [Oceanobacillus jordanicus]MCG3420305.1 methyl-accepting chemotaxis protein [Oceanobacillus jordanicus]